MLLIFLQVILASHCYVDAPAPWETYLKTLLASFALFEALTWKSSATLELEVQLKPLSEQVNLRNYPNTSHLAGLGGGG